MYLLFVKVIVWALLGLVALVAIPICAVLLFGVWRRIQIVRTRRELDRMGFVGSGPDPRDRRRFWPLVEAGLIGLVALAVATLVLPGPPVNRILASTDGASVSSAPMTHAPVVPPSPDAGSAHTPSSAPAMPAHGDGSSPSSPATPGSPAAAAGSDAGAPSTVTARSTSATAIQLQWAPVTGAARFDVERSTDAVTWNVVASTGGGETSYTDATVSSGTTYYYRVAAVDGADVSRSDVVSATTTVDTPTAPVLLSATGSATSVDLTWSDVDTQVSYEVDRSPDGTSGWTAIGTTGQDVTSFTDTGLPLSTTYYYRVVAVTSDGTSSAPSGVLSATTGVGESSGGPSTSDANADPSLAPTGP
jgi:fibronectin type III domain protein